MSCFNKKKFHFEKISVEWLTMSWNVTFCHKSHVQIVTNSNVTILNATSLWQNSNDKLERIRKVSHLSLTRLIPGLHCETSDTIKIKIVKRICVTYSVS